MVGQRLSVGDLETPNLGKHIVAQDRPIEPLLRHVPTEHGRVVEVLGEMRSIDEQLLRHAAADHACAANLVLLGNGNASSVSGGDTSGPDSARAAADHE